MSHTFTADFGLNDFNAAFLTDNAAVFHPLVLAAVALVVLNGAKYL